MSFGGFAERSGGKGSCCFSPSFSGSPGRLFFFSLVVGGCLRDWEKARFALVPTRNANTSTKLKNERKDLSTLIVTTPEVQAKKFRTFAAARSSIQQMLPRFVNCLMRGRVAKVYYGRCEPPP